MNVARATQLLSKTMSNVIERYIRADDTLPHMHVQSLNETGHADGTDKLSFRQRVAVGVLAQDDDQLDEHEHETATPP